MKAITHLTPLASRTHGLNHTAHTLAAICIILGLGLARAQFDAGTNKTSGGGAASIAAPTTPDRSTPIIPATVPSVAPSNGAAPTNCVEDLGYDIVDGKTNKIAKVSSVTPVYVFVIYEGGLGGRKIPYYDLSPQLKSKFRFDQRKADEYQKRMDELARQNEAGAAKEVERARTAHRTLLEDREKVLFGELETLRKKDVELQRDINHLNRMPAGGGRKRLRDELVLEQENLRIRIEHLEDELENVRAQHDTLLSGR